MNIDDSRLITRFQRLITEMLVEKRLGQRRPELTDEVYQTWREVEQRGLKETPEYRNVLLRADRHALWLAGLVRLAAPIASSPETERTDMFLVEGNALAYLRFDQSELCGFSSGPPQPSRSLRIFSPYL
jgi:hypothetical protein